MGVEIWLPGVICGTLAFSVLIGLYVIYQTWIRRSSVGKVAYVFSALCLSCCEWSCCYLLELVTRDPATKYFWYNLKQVGSNVTLPCLLLFFFYYNDPTFRLRPWQAVLIFAEPTLMILLNWTNQWHHLLVKGMVIRPYLGFLVLDPLFGRVNQVDSLYNMFLFAGTLALLVAHYARAPRFYRPPLRLMLIGILIAATGDIVAAFKLVQQFFDLSPLCFAVTLLLFDQSIRRYRVFDTVPVARDLIFGYMQEGAILLSPDFLVLDINAAATRILNCDERRVRLGQSVDHILPSDVSIAALQNNREMQVPLMLQGTPHYFDFQLSPLEVKSAGQPCLLIMISDITQPVLAKQQLELSKASLEIAYTQLEQINQKLEEKRRSEAAISSGIQQSLLVWPAPQGLPGVHIATLSLPSQYVDGDFCDFYTHSDKVFDLVVGDVMGKGFSAALLGAATKTQILRALNYLMSRSPSLPSPEAVVQWVHRHLTPRLIPLDTFVTLVYTRFDLEQWEALIVDCGHTATLHSQVARRESCLLQGDNLPFGVLPNEQYRQFRVSFAPEDLLIFYSDGVTEAADDQRQMYGVARLQELIALHHFRSPVEIAAALRADLERFTGADHFNDDVTCIVVSIETYAQTTGCFEPDVILEPIFTADLGQATANYLETGS